MVRMALCTIIGMKLGSEDLRTRQEICVIVLIVTCLADPRPGPYKREA